MVLISGGLITYIVLQERDNCVTIVPPNGSSCRFVVDDPKIRNNTKLYTTNTKNYRKSLLLHGKSVILNEEDLMPRLLPDLTGKNRWAKIY
jgi:hypothetical protein